MEFVNSQIKLTVYLLFPLNLHVAKLEYKNIFISFQNLKLIMSNDKFILVLPEKYCNIKTSMRYSQIYLS